MLKNILTKIHWVLSSQFGLDPQRLLLSIRGIPAYLRDWIKFRKSYTGKMSLRPCLHDRYEEGGTTKSEYFWQDLIVARKIFSARPHKHVDIGSRVDGFVAHVASFRDIEVFDVRVITTQIPGVIFKQADLMNPIQGMSDYCDSLSCLHALEHFGLGRYGDPIDPKGYESGIANMARILSSGGTFYLAVPVGLERVEFNANRVFDPNSIISVAEKNNLFLNEFELFSAHDGLIKLNATYEELSSIGKLNYALGIFTFKKT